jgi:O-antigen ligase
MHSRFTAGALLDDTPQVIRKRLSRSMTPKAIVCYAYYGFVFTLPFESAMGGLSRLGLLLFALTVCQLQFFFRSFPPAFWCFLTYLCVVACLGFILLFDAYYDAEFTGEWVTNLFRLSQLLLFFVIAFKLMKVGSVAKNTLLIFGLSCTFLAILQLLGIIAATVGDERLTTSFGDNPNVVASVLSLGLLGLFGLAYRRKDTSMKVRLLAWCSSPFLLIVIARTGSRGGQIALLLALIALFFKPASLPQRIRKIFVGFLIVVGLSWSVYESEFVRQRWENTYYEGDVAGREVLMPIAWEMFLERPLLGWGPVYHYWEMNIRTNDSDGGDPHNLYLWLLKETGLLGGIPFFVGLLLCWGSAWKARVSHQDSLPLAYLVFMLVANLKGTYLYFKLFWLVLAYALASGSDMVAHRPLPTQKAPLSRAWRTRLRTGLHIKYRPHHYRFVRPQPPR